MIVILGCRTDNDVLEIPIRLSHYRNTSELLIYHYAEYSQWFASFSSINFSHSVEFLYNPVNPDVIYTVDVECTISTKLINNSSKWKLYVSI